MLFPTHFFDTSIVFARKTKKKSLPNVFDFCSNLSANMKRKRSPSPVSRRTSRSPLSPRSTRASNRTPPSVKVSPDKNEKMMNGEVNGVNDEEESPSFSIRRSSRARRGSSLHIDYITSPVEVIRDRNRSKEKEVNDTTPTKTRSKIGRSRSSSPDTEEIETPFYGVRFSPSAKPSSPARWQRRSTQRASAKIASMRLQNVPSEDEQSEFNRRYTRDLRSRRGREDKNDIEETEFSTPRTRRSSSNNRKAKKEIAQEEMDEDEEEESTPTLRNSRSRRLAARRRSETELNEDAEDERSEIEHEDEDNEKTNNIDVSASGRPIRRVTRNRLNSSTGQEVINEVESEDEEDVPIGRRTSARRSSNNKKPRGDEMSISSEPIMSSQDGIRRSSRRIPKPILKEPKEDSSSDDSDDKNDENSARPKRSRAPVERFGYEPTPPSSSKGRRRSSEVRNLDQYSTDDEYMASHDDSRRRKKYNMRPPAPIQRKSNPERRKKSSHRQRDTSSSSSSDSIDEQRFAKRKNKRMMVERSKLRPVNMTKSDANKAIFRDRQHMGASMADIQPMEMDMGVTFESVGGVDGHVNSLKEMVIFPLLYPEIFTKFNIIPPRGVLFYGPPGTGKTLMARALASECSQDGRKVAFFMRKGADCLSKWIGESERQLRLLFDQAYVMRPSIIFFDEIDGLAPVRSSRNDQIHSSIVSTLLALMDGLDNRGEIIVIGATNRIENIDPALRRPGRFDRELRFGLPTRDSRKDILSLHTKTWNPPIDKGLIDALADKSIGYSGADLKGLCAEAALNALRRRYPQVYRTNQKLALDFDIIKISEVDFDKAMENLVPSTHRIQDQSQSPLIPRLRPLLGTVVEKICKKIDAVYKGKEFSFRPRILIKGKPGHCVATYIGPAILHHLEKLPCHKLDIPSLYSNAARSPEEAMFHIIHEAKRTAPSVLYIPHFSRLLNKVFSSTQQEAFNAMMTDIQPTAPLIVIAFTEDSNEEDGNTDFSDNFLEEMFNPDTEVVETSSPTREERKAYFNPIFEMARELPEEEEAVAAPEDELEEEILEVLPVPESRELTEKEEKRLRRKEDSLLRELRIFLRETWNKINREQKFFMFRTEIDTEEIDDYLDYVTKPMDFDTMLTKLDNAEYHCAQEFLDDIDLISENALKYNSDLAFETNKVICHRARALQDFAYALVKAEMDTDFEDNCKEIVQRRTKLTEKLKKPQESVSFDPRTNQIVKSSVAQRRSGEVTAKPKKKKARKSRWSSGFVSKPSRKPKPKDTSDKDDENSEHNNDGSDTDEPDTTLNDSKDLKVDQKKLKKIEDDLINKTEELTTEVLERIYITLNECVVQYRNVYDRTQLPSELTDRLTSLKVF